MRSVGPTAGATSGTGPSANTSRRRARRATNTGSGSSLPMTAAPSSWTGNHCIAAPTSPPCPRRPRGCPWTSPGSRAWSRRCGGRASRRTCTRSTTARPRRTSSGRLRPWRASCLRWTRHPRSWRRVWRPPGNSWRTASTDRWANTTQRRAFHARRTSSTRSARATRCTSWAKASTSCARSSPRAATTGASSRSGGSLVARRRAASSCELGATRTR
mmetsp:Transcript_110527/g.356765  ORF Transcript_110527/g.356765 Transcript_110527/m.356765 type:complete len:216 (+) Transcript_110527:1012-1659(+)